jgi:hypothetical protein
MSQTTCIVENCAWQADWKGGPEGSCVNFCQHHFHKWGRTLLQELPRANLQGDQVFVQISRFGERPYTQRQLVVQPTMEGQLSVTVQEFNFTNATWSTRMEPALHQPSDPHFEVTVQRAWQSLFPPSPSQELCKIRVDVSFSPFTDKPPKSQLYQKLVGKFGSASFRFSFTFDAPCFFNA